ncbi:15839_t:CDS:2, partial [Racocetra persica]
MPTPRLSQQDFERIERNQRYHVNDLLKSCFNVLGGNFYESLAKNVEIYVNSGSGESGQKERSNEVKKKLMEMFFNPGSRQNLQNAITKIEPYFEGSQSGASGRARTLFRNFRYYNDMMFGAFDHFAEHLGRTRRAGLNYSDGREPSPRLEAVKEYYSLICVVREILATIEQEIGREQLNRNFGEERARQMFNDIFAEELLRGREGEVPPSNQNRGEGSFN